MKILHVTTHECAGGAATAAMRLHTALLRQGLDSQAVVLDREGENPHTALLGGKISRRIIRPFIRTLEGRLRNAIYSRPPHPAYSTYSMTPTWNHVRLNGIVKDVLHLHWLGEGFLTPFSLEFLRGPVVWTMCDTWPFTGGCHFTSSGCTRYREQCGMCPELCSRRAIDASRLHWLWKRRAVTRIRPVMVSPSQAYAERARQSGMLRGCRIEVIPNGLDVEVFRPLPKAQAREILGLPQAEPLLLFGAMLATEDHNKGFDLLRDALFHLKARNRPDFSAVVFGSAGKAEALPCPTHFLGKLHDPVALALAYSAADIFICPSRQESFSNTTMEAMACGIPVAAFAVGGIPDLVEDGLTGCLAQPYDSAALARSIGEILDSPENARRMGLAAREKVEREYSLALLGQRHLALYNSILKAE